MALAPGMEHLVEDEGEYAVAEHLPGYYRGFRPTMHPAHPDHAEASAFSDPWSLLWLERKEWFSVMLALDMTEGELHDVDDAPTMFHGTEWGAAFQIVRNKAFIIGQGTHAVRGTSRAGCWCVPTLGDALTRCQPRRFMDREHDITGYSRWSCPVVLQLRAVRYVKAPRSTMHCAPGNIGSVHNGLVIDEIHFNTRLMRNFMALERQSVRRTLRADPHWNRICNCGLCGIYLRADDRWEWRKSNAGHYYHPRCYKRIVCYGAHVAHWF